MFFPSNILTDSVFSNILSSLPTAVDKTLNCLGCWRDYADIRCIDPLHSRQYATVLAILSRNLYKCGMKQESEMVSYVNKIVNGCEIFGHVNLKPNFLLGHTLGIVLGKANYGDFLCIQHNVTVGRWGNDIPSIHDRVMIMNGAVIAGKSIIGENSIVSSGVRVINQKVPANSIAFSGRGKELVLKPNSKNYINQWLSSHAFGTVNSSKGR